MKNIITIIISALFAASCGASATRAHKAQSDSATKSPAAEPTHYSYIVRNTYPHSTASYTQGLFFADGVLWEGTGEYGHSQLQKLDLATGKANVMARLPRTEFGEGAALLGEQIYQLTWTSNTAHVYDRHTGTKTKEFRYEGEGWGITTDGQKLYMSNGTEYIHMLDPATFRRERSVVVTYKGEPMQLLNELEWIDGKIWANVYTTNQIVIIDPATGVVEGVADLTGILPAEEIHPETDVLNGIAHDPATGRIFVTGKRWSKLFEIEIVKQ